jgi:uncharacterized protein (TIGR02118 family)
MATSKLVMLKFFIHNFKGNFMYKMIAIYKQPQDAASFDKWYEDHKEIARKVPLVHEFRFSKITGTPRGTSDLYLIAELVFKSKDDFKVAMSSPENMNAGKDAFANAKDIISVHFAEEEIVRN